MATPVRAKITCFLFHKDFSNRKVCIRNELKHFGDSNFLLALLLLLFLLIGVQRKQGTRKGMVVLVNITGGDQKRTKIICSFSIFLPRLHYRWPLISFFFSIFLRRFFTSYRITNYGVNVSISETSSNGHLRKFEKSRNHLFVGCFLLFPDNLFCYRRRCIIALFTSEASAKTRYKNCT